MHDHPDSVVVVLNGGKTKFTTPDGHKSQEQDMAANTALYLPAGKHLPMNMGATASLSILVEFKGVAPGKAALPTSRAGMTLAMLAEGAHSWAVPGSDIGRGPRAGPGGARMGISRWRPSHWRAGTEGRSDLPGCRSRVAEGLCRDEPNLSACAKTTSPC